MTLDQVLSYYRSYTAAAKAIGLKPPSLYGWKEAGEIPIDRQCQFEVVTAGALLADRTKLGMQPREAQSQQQATSGQRRQQMG